MYAHNIQTSLYIYILMTRQRNIQVMKYDLAFLMFLQTFLEKGWVLLMNVNTWLVNVRFC